MQTIRKLTYLWRRWINQKNTFNSSELDEMEDHLIEDVKWFMDNDNISEEEAFHKSIESIGKKNELLEAKLVFEKEKKKTKFGLYLGVIFSIGFICISILLANNYLLKNFNIANNVPSGYPCSGDIEVHFGYWIHPIWGTPDFHLGVDIPIPEGSNLVATCAGTVSSSGYNGGYGYSIIIKHSDTYSTRYAHCSELLVKVGDTVTNGQVIAKAGRTGTATHSHVHYEVIKNDKPIDPENLMEQVIENRKFTKQKWLHIKSPGTNVK